MAASNSNQPPIMSSMPWKWALHPWPNPGRLRSTIDDLPPRQEVAICVSVALFSD
jgi:hypothetical protein